MVNVNRHNNKVKPPTRNRLSRHLAGIIPTEQRTVMNNKKQKVWGHQNGIGSQVGPGNKLGTTIGSVDKAAACACRWHRYSITGQGTPNVPT